MQYTGSFVRKLFKVKIYRMKYFRHKITVHYRKHLEITVAEKDTAAAAKATVGRLKAAVGRQRAAHRLWLAAAAQPRPPICLKIDSLAYDWLTGSLSRTHAQGVSLSVIVRTICIGIWARWVIANGDQIQQSNGLGLIWILSILATWAKMLVGHAYQPRGFCPCARSTNLPDHAHHSV